MRRPPSFSPPSTSGSALPNWYLRSLVSAKRWEQLPCDHARLLLPPNVDVVAAGISQAIDEFAARAERRVTREPGWTSPPARPTLEPGELAVWLLDADVERPLETVAARYLGVAVDDVSIVRTVEGKPAVEGAALEVNLAHSGSVALVAVAREGDVGVDVEQLREDFAGWSLPCARPGPSRARTR